MFIFSFVRKFDKILSVTDGSVVIIALHRLGDTVFTIPAIEEIKNEYNREIIVFCYLESLPIYKLALKNVSFITVERTDFFFGNRIANFQARSKLYKSNPYIIIDITGVMTSASLIFNSRAATIVGMNREIFKSIYDYYTPVIYESHLGEMYLNVARIVNKKNKYVDSIYSNLSINKVENIVIHPFAGWKAKEWSLRKFILLASLLKKNYDVAILIPNNYLNEESIEEIKNMNIEIHITSSIDDLISVLRNYSLLIGNDSGPIHIASLLGKATFSIYGPSNPKFTLPDGFHHGFYHKKIKCSPLPSKNLCFKDGGRFGCPSFECMEGLSFEVVFEEIKKFISNLDDKILEKKNLKINHRNYS